jgi:hypothetical protein
MLQVLPSHHTLAIPISAFAMSSSLRPVPYSMAWEAPWDFGAVIRALYLFNFPDIVFSNPIAGV